MAQIDEFQQALDIEDLKRRTEVLEKDMTTIKPIVYDTAASAKSIEKSVSKMEANSEKIKGYFLAAAISGVVGVVFIAIQQYLGGQ